MAISPFGLVIYGVPHAARLCDSHEALKDHRKQALDSPFRRPRAARLLCQILRLLQQNSGTGWRKSPEAKCKAPIQWLERRNVSVMLERCKNYVRADPVTGPPDRRITVLSRQHVRRICLLK